MHPKLTAVVATVTVATAGIAGPAAHAATSHPVRAGVSAAAKPRLSVHKATRVATAAAQAQFRFETGQSSQPTSETPTDWGVGKAKRVSRSTVDVIVGLFYGYQPQGELVCGWTERVSVKHNGRVIAKDLQDTECTPTGEPAQQLPAGCPHPPPGGRGGRSSPRSADRR
jgi:hypothetical protein